MQLAGWTATHLLFLKAILPPATVKSGLQGLRLNILPFWASRDRVCQGVAHAELGLLDSATVRTFSEYDVVRPGRASYDVRRVHLQNGLISSYTVFVFSNPERRLFGKTFDHMQYSAVLLPATPNNERVLQLHIPCLWYQPRRTVGTNIVFLC